MDIVPTPMSNPAPQVAVSPINPVPQADPDIAAQTAPALDRLNNAFQQGLVTSDDLQKLFIGGTEMAKAGPLAAADIQAANLRRAVQPAQAQAAIEDAKTSAATSAEIRSVLPYKQALDIAAAHQGASEATLAATKAQASLPDAELTQREMEMDPTGQKTALRDFFSQLLVGEPLPLDKTSPTGLDYDQMERALYGKISGKDATNTPQSDMDGSLHSMVIQRMNDRWFSTDQGKALTAAIADKHADDLRYNPDGSLKDFFTLQRDVAAAPARYNADERDKALADYTQVLKPQRDQLNEITKLVNTPGFIGRGVGSGDIVGKISAEARAALGLGNIKYKGQNEIEMALNAQKQKIMAQVHNIRNLYEFNAVTGSLPAMDSTPQVWNDWLTRAQAQIDDAAKITKDHVPTEDLGDLPPVWTPSGTAGSAAPAASAVGVAAYPAVTDVASLEAAIQGGANIVTYQGRTYHADALMKLQTGAH